MDTPEEDGQMKKIKIKIDVNIPEIGSFQPTLGRVTGNLEHVNSSDRLPYCRAGIIHWMSPELDEISFIILYFTFLYAEQLSDYLSGFRLD